MLKIETIFKFFTRYKISGKGIRNMSDSILPLQPRSKPLIYFSRGNAGSAGRIEYRCQKHNSKIECFWDMSVDRKIGGWNKYYFYGAFYLQIPYWTTMVVDSLAQIIFMVYFIHKPRLAIYL